ncbi:hypothetical protein ACFSHT_27470 [Paraburkholderia silviterrae]|uniref:Preprotein translocase subunit SecA n=1 Tax=Paraburkholderia silviterrae TaxID=2528715 RepID=A0A4R5M095_9BURK|nr:hypothetical protein [Paraburkholderia silviterrae]TDG18340.1 hypothetical protein EYW47_34775 [Paraburkholderia silviterrae]
MLSPHEFATLMLIRHAPEQIDMNRHELDTLLEHQLVALVQRGEGLHLPSLTMAGRSLLDALGRVEPAYFAHEDMSSCDAH